MTERTWAMGYEPRIVTIETEHWGRHVFIGNSAVGQESYNPNHLPACRVAVRIMHDLVTVREERLPCKVLVTAYVLNAKVEQWGSMDYD